MACELMLKQSFGEDHSSCILQDVPTVEGDGVKDLEVEDIGGRQLSRYLPFHSESGSGSGSGGASKSGR